MPLLWLRRAQDSELKSTSRTALLGEIPVLGRPFALDETTRAKTELYIVIAPHIVRGRPG